MIIDCDTCAAPAAACADCVMTVLSRPDSAGRTLVDLDPTEQDAIGSLVRAGLVPPLRLVRPVTGPDVELLADAQGDLPDSSRLRRGIA